MDTTGDNLLAEFASAVDAVNCAVEIQRELAERNAELPYERKMEFRIGVNIGDVIEEKDRIYGDGVNIAARVEGLAEAGGICISGRVYDQVENKLNLEYEYLGEKEVKNITRPIRVYHVLSYPGAAAHRVVQAKESVGRKWRKIVLVITAFLLMCVVTFAIWNIYFRLPSIELVFPGKIEINLPEGPSVAVLPFVNMSEDSKQEYFSDGLTENIITGLSTCPKLFVIARNSTFAYKGKPLKVQQIASELGVRYIVEGSVQRSNNRVRITVQLINGTTGHHVWAEKYDRKIKDIFALQDEITIKIMTALEVKLTEGEQARARLLGQANQANLDAFMKALKALKYIRRENKEDNILARQEITQAISLAPDYSGAYALLAMTYIMDAWLGSKYPLVSFAQASRFVKKAITLDPNNSDAYLVLSILNFAIGQHEQEIASGEMAVSLNPNGADAYSQLAFALYMSDRPSEAIELFKKAIRLNPMPPGYYYINLGTTYRALGMYEEALEAFMKAIQREPNDLFARVYLASIYSLLGREEDAKAEAAEVLRIDPKFSLNDYEKFLTEKNRAYVKLFMESARQAGLR